MGLGQSTPSYSPSGENKVNFTEMSLEGELEDVLNQAIDNGYDVVSVESIGGNRVRTKYLSNLANKNFSKLLRSDNIISQPYYSTYVFVRDPDIQNAGIRTQVDIPQPAGAISMGSVSKYTTSGGLPPLSSLGNISCPITPVDKTNTYSYLPVKNNACTQTVNLNFNNTSKTISLTDSAENGKHSILSVDPNTGKVIQKQVDITSTPLTSNPTWDNWSFDRDGYIHSLVSPWMCLESRNMFEEDKFFTLSNKQTGLCVHPEGGSDNPGAVRAVFHPDNCGDKIPPPKVTFYIDEKNNIRHKSGKCLAAWRNGTVKNDSIFFSSNCDQPFTVLPDGTIKHANSGMCIHPYRGTANKGTPLVLYPECNEGPRIQFNQNFNGLYAMPCDGNKSQKWEIFKTDKTNTLMSQAVTNTLALPKPEIANICDMYERQLQKLNVYQYTHVKSDKWNGVQNELSRGKSILLDKCGVNLNDYSNRNVWQEYKTSSPKEDAVTICSNMLPLYDAKPGVSWGSMPETLKSEVWELFDCDTNFKPETAEKDRRWKAVRAGMIAEKYKLRNAEEEMNKISVENLPQVPYFNFDF